MRGFSGKFISFLAIVVVALAFSPRGAVAGGVAEGSIAVQTLDYSRGQAESRNSFIVVPAVKVSRGYFSLGMEGVLDLAPHAAGAESKTANLQKSTIVAAYGAKTDVFSMKLAAAFNGKEGARDEKELSFSLGMEEGPILPFFALYQTVGINPALYAEIGASHTTEISKGMTLNVAVKFGYFTSQTEKDEQHSPAHYRTLNDGVLSEEKYSGWLDGVITAKMAVDLGDGVRLEPFLSLALPLSNDAKNYFKANCKQGFADGSTSHLWGGVSLSF